MFKEFKEFLTKGNLIEIAVGLVLALIFTAVVKSFVDDILMQVVAAIGGQPDFSSLTIELGDGRIRYGSFLNAVIYFLIVGFLLFLVMKAYSALRRETPSETDEEILLLREIRDSLRARG